MFLSDILIWFGIWFGFFGVSNWYLDAKKTNYVDSFAHLSIWFLIGIFLALVVFPFSLDYLKEIDPISLVVLLSTSPTLPCWLLFAHCSKTKDNTIYDW